MAEERLFELDRRTFDTPHFRGIDGDRRGSVPAGAGPKKRLGRIAARAIKVAGGVRNRPSSARLRRSVTAPTSSTRDGSFPGQQMSLL